MSYLIWLDKKFTLSAQTEIVLKYLLNKNLTGDSIKNE